MRFGILTLALSLLALPALADDFGPRFTGEQPSALMDPAELSNIAPAAGEPSEKEEMSEMEIQDALEAPSDMPSADSAQ